MQSETFKRWLVGQIQAIAEKTIERYVRNPPGLNPWYRFGTVVAVVNGLPSVRWDWETGADARTYPHLASYTPTVGDRVALQASGGAWIVAGKVIAG